MLARASMIIVEEGLMDSTAASRVVAAPQPT